MKTLFFSLLLCLPFFALAQRPDFQTKLSTATPAAAAIGPTGCALAVVDQKCGGTPGNQYSGHYIAGTFARGMCSPNSNIRKVRVRYRNKTDNGPMQIRTYDFRGNWYIQNLDPDKEYEIHVEVKFSLTGFFRAAGRVDEWSSCNQTQMTVNGVARGELDVCGNNAIILDGAASTNETGYIIAIRELNASYQTVGSERLRHFNGAAPARFDVRSFAASQGFPLQFGKRYAIKLVTKPIWREQSVIVNLKTLRNCASTPADIRVSRVRRSF